MTVQDAKEIQEIKSRTLSNSHRIDECVSRITKVEEKQELMYQMNENIALMAQSMKNIEGNMQDMNTDIKDLSGKVNALENAPAKEMLENYKKVKFNVSSALAISTATALLGAVIGFILGK